MKAIDAILLVDLLKEKGISFDKGLSEIEMKEIKTQFNVEFPEDLGIFLKTSLPISQGFVHWRYGINSEKGKKEIFQKLDNPLNGILFDMKYNSFWFEKWGAMPDTFEKKKTLFEAEYLKIPKLIPIYSHRYIPKKPKELGNPVFSVHQTDIIYYGYDLLNYFENEFKIKLPEKYGNRSYPKPIDFWSEFDPFDPIDVE